MVWRCARPATTALMGMGLGTYARTALAREPSDEGPGNFVLGAENGQRYLALEGGLPLYVGQRVTVARDQRYRLSFALRATGGYGPVVAILCEKVLLYSAHCHSAAIWPRRDGAWQDVDGTISTTAIGSGSRFEALRRPVEFALFVPILGSTDDVANLRLTDAAGRELIANGDFAQGMAHWFYSDDVHTVWRIENQYLMTLFEEGALGLGALALLMGALRTMGRRASHPRRPDDGTSRRRGARGFPCQRALRLPARSAAPRNARLSRRLRRNHDGRGDEGHQCCTHDKGLGDLPLGP